MKKADLTQDHLKSLLTYDPETGAFKRLKIKHPCRAGKPAGYLDKGYVWISLSIEGKRFVYGAQRLAWLYMTGSWPDEMTDHINRDRADNRFCNLREVTRAENAENQNLSVANKSGYTGVFFHKNLKERPWQASITRDRKSISLGYFSSRIKAVLVRKQAEIEYGFLTNTVRI